MREYVMQPSAENVIQDVIYWAAASGVSKMQFSDDPTNFKNDTVRFVSEGLKVPH